MTDLNLFRRKIRIYADIDSVYNSFTERIALENWFLRKAEFTTAGGKVRASHEQFCEGDSYYWLWHGFGDEVFEKRKIITANGSNKIVFEFSGDTTVEINLTAYGNQTEIELIQTGFPEDAERKIDYYVGCSTGWTFYLANLKSILEGGIDLRNKDENFQDAANA
jgi:uncharacterized protein YndB with AHSA1/START domain